jgi:hypothetical protein
VRSSASRGDDVNVYEYLSSWSNHVHSWTQTANPTLLTLRYEDMLDQLLKSFGSVAKFLGLDVARPRLDKAMKLSSFKLLKAQEQRKGFIERPAAADAAFFREGEAGQWKKDPQPGAGRPDRGQPWRTDASVRVSLGVGHASLFPL